MTIRVRFAPSPTGLLHVGNVRTALFNDLYARKTGATFVLRVEDTDEERSAAVHETALLEDLAWLGIRWQEGPDTGGPFGPYRQSERAGLYADVLAELKNRELSYPCFCSEEDLALMRRIQAQRGEPPRYDGRYRDYPRDEAARRIAAGEPHTWRFKLTREISGGEVVFEDMVFGARRFLLDHIGDFVLVRADGSATYPFAVVLDDIAMRITHVIRGVDHIANTARQIPLYQALGAAPPHFAHLPLVLAPGCDEVLSKRTGAASVRELRERGYLPGALRNALAMLGWSPPPGREMLRGDELTEAWDLAAVRTSPGHFNPEQLDWLNGRYLRELPAGEILEELYRYAPGLASVPSPEGAPMDAGAWKRLAVETFREQSITLRDLADAIASLAAYEGKAALPGEFTADLTHDLGALPAWTPESIADVIKRVGKAHGLTGKGLFMPLREALTGKEGGPHLNGIVALLGPAETGRRLRGGAP